MNNATGKVAAVLFDMDGVLVDSTSVIEQAWCEAAQRYGRNLTREEIRDHIHGQPGPHTIRALFHDLPLVEQQKIQAFIIDTENTVDCEPIPGVAQFITALHHAGVPLGIVTSGWRKKIDRVIASIYASSFFSVIVERDDVMRGKPWPDPYLLAAERLGISATKALVFEDAKSGITSAVAAGAWCVGVGGECLLSWGAKSVIPDFCQAKVQTFNNTEVLISFDSTAPIVVEI